MIVIKSDDDGDQGTEDSKKETIVKDEREGVKEDEKEEFEDDEAGRQVISVSPRFFSQRLPRLVIDVAICRGRDHRRALHRLP